MGASVQSTSVIQSVGYEITLTGGKYGRRVATEVKKSEASMRSKMVYCVQSF